MLEIKNLTYETQGKTILDNITCQIPAQKLSIILGPNGSGKSSLLKCITQEYNPNSGSILINKEEVSNLSLTQQAKKIAILSQFSSIEFPFTVAQIVEMGRYPFKDDYTTQQNQDIVKTVLDSVDLSGFQSRIYNTLSGGEKQRVQLARVFAQLHSIKQGILILDEPTSALDIKHQYLLMKSLRNQIKNKRLTVLMVIHDLTLAQKFADHILLMKNSQLKHQGKTKEIMTPQILNKIFEVDLFVH